MKSESRRPIFCLLTSFEGVLIGSLAIPEWSDRQLAMLKNFGMFQCDFVSALATYAPNSQVSNKILPEVQDCLASRRGDLLHRFYSLNLAYWLSSSSYQEQRAWQII